MPRKLKKKKAIVSFAKRILQRTVAMSKKTLSLFSVISVFWSFQIPHLIIFYGFIWLIVSTFNTLLEGSNFERILTIYIAMVGITLAIGSTAFTYSRISSKRDAPYVRSFGEGFFLSALQMVVALLITGITFYLSQAVPETIPLYNAFKILSGLLLGIGQVFLLFAIVYFSSALKHLERFLFFKVRDNKIVDLDKF